ncbi:MAG: prolipoprotein diacylglyceryl transferase [Oscillospiraceae bacterium]|nr:prolipoprotein diacylglyceryl transferase [Oscillospiraceae bacterium]
MTVLSATMMRGAEISFPMLGDFKINPPDSFTLFGLSIYFYAVIIACGMVAAALYCAKRASKFGLTEDNLYDFLLWAIPLCVIGARLYFVAFKWDFYRDNLSDIINIREGGLAIYGGVLMGILVALLWSRAKKIPFFALADLASFGLLIGQAIGRWGNFMNREAFGAQTDIFCRMGLNYPGDAPIYVHPTFLYESLWNFIGLAFLHIWTQKGGRRYDGQVFWLYIFWYGLGRAWIEGLRTDSLYIGDTTLRVSQLLAAASSAAALVILIIKAKKKSNPAEMYVNRQGERQENNG